MKEWLLVVGIAYLVFMLAACTAFVVLLAPLGNTLSSKAAFGDAGLAASVVQTQSGARPSGIPPSALTAVGLIEKADAGSLARLVRSSGLVIAPYAVGAPDQGLKGEALRQALEAMLVGTHPKVVAYNMSEQGRVDLVVTGLNAVEITPAVGDALTMTSPALVSLADAGNGNWELWLVAVDNLGQLAQNMTTAPFRPWQK